ncbi:phosphate signaling complex protein PhoU [Marinobacter koreensis]|jgi:phosphate transport system protein|uniref:Phosphate-specific transport system accessory protein PhoU n=1 Tax=Marinobacter koreensis TaxID=335974 RepID=A0ABW0RP82_9GAMM|nr:phosphate signaling complex protein PhoU [Marinobacter koreensis]MCK7547667.1 phosphate signaling complex protein PhoU [Marinobacter koreensis]
MPDKKDMSHGDHISAKFDEDLAELKANFLKMGGMVESHVAGAVTALVENDGHLGEKVRDGDKQVDQLELLIDEEATHIIARRQPTARDLRLVIAVIKMVADLERIGDEAKKIAKLAITLAEEGKAPRGYVEVQHIANHVRGMLRDALDAFARLDPEPAIGIMKEDKRVDEEYKAAARSLLTFMMEDTRNISKCMSVMWILRALERVGDHACNIAENVIYMVEGEDVRHKPTKWAEQVVGS